MECNEPPPDADIPEVQDAISELTTRLKQIDARVSALEASLKTLRNAKRALTSELAPIRAITSHLRQIPTDILCEIFTACLPGADGYFNQAFQGEDIVVKRSTYPWAIAAVCQRWRQVALSFPPMWSEFSFTWSENYFSGKITHKLNSTAAKLQIKRASCQSLLVSLNLYNHATIKGLPRLLGLLVPTSPKWRYLHVSLSGLRNLAGLADHITLADLETFGLIHEEVDVDRILAWQASSILLNAPQLRKIFGPPSILSELQLPWAQITQVLPRQIVSSA